MVIAPSGLIVGGSEDDIATTRIETFLGGGGGGFNVSPWNFPKVFWVHTQGLFIFCELRKHAFDESMIQPSKITQGVVAKDNTLRH